MKYLVYLVVFSILFINQEIVFSQNKGNKIETWEVWHARSEWTYENNHGNVNTNCIVKMRLVFENNSQKHVSKITLILKIKNCDGTLLYKKKHTISVDLDSGDKAASKEFNLAEKVCDFKCGFSDGDNVTVDTEILSVK